MLTAAPFLRWERLELTLRTYTLIARRQYSRSFYLVDRTEPRARNLDIGQTWLGIVVRTLPEIPESRERYSRLSENNDQHHQNENRNEDVQDSRERRGEAREVCYHWVICNRNWSCGCGICQLDVPIIRPDLLEFLLQEISQEINISHHAVFQR